MNLLAKEPTNGKIGRLIKNEIRKGRSTSFKSLQLLFCADRAMHLEDEIEPAIKQGKTIVCDRYLFSTLAYGFASGINFEWLYAINKTFRTPDLTIFIDISPDVSMKRSARKTERVELFEKRESLNKVRKAYLNLAKRFKFRIVNGENGAKETDAEIARLADEFLGIKAKHK